MVGLAPAALWLAVATSVSADVLPAEPNASFESSIGGREIVACEAGGMNSESCNVHCHVIFNFYTTSCEVTCRTGYFACCNCDTGCQCVIDHDEMWSIPPPDQPHKLVS